jgi:hypothetical protein
MHRAKKTRMAVGGLKYWRNFYFALIGCGRFNLVQGESRLLTRRIGPVPSHANTRKPGIYSWEASTARADDSPRRPKVSAVFGTERI